MEHENVFLFEYALIVPAVLKCLLQHNLPIWKKIVVYPLEKNYPYLLIFAPIKDFLHVYNVEQPGQT